MLAIKNSDISKKISETRLRIEGLKRDIAYLNSWLNSWEKEFMSDEGKEKIKALIADYSAQLNKLEQVRQQHIQLITGLEHDNCREVLTKRYVELMKFEDIANVMMYDLSYIYRLHKKGLQLIKKEYEKNGKRNINSIEKN